MNPWLIALLVVSIMYAITMVLLTVLLRDEQKARAAASEKWAAILNQISEAHAAELREVAERYVRAFKPEALGEPQAIHIPREPDAEERLGREISETTRKIGIEALREMYRQNGITRSDQELADEVDAVAQGRPYVQANGA